MCPILSLELEIISEYQLSIDHLALLPSGLVVVALSLLLTKYIGIDEIALAVEVPLHKLSLIHDAVVHFEFAIAMVPSLLVLSLVFVFQAGWHWLL